MNLHTHFNTTAGPDISAHYNAAVCRILKEKSNGDYTFYVKDGAVTLAVMDESGFSHFNFTKPGGAVFGRYAPGTGARYYLKDHLGSTRLVTDQNDGVIATFDYYPFGLLMPERYTVNNSTTEKFTSKELDSSLGLYYFGARYYDAALARWLVPDRFAAKYPSLSPYNYAANNPLSFVDVNGDTINVASMRIYDDTFNTNHLSSLNQNLEKITGLSLSVGEKGNLSFKKDKHGDPTISKDSKGNLLGSKTARGILTNAINAKQTVSVSTITHRGSVAGANQIGLNPNQISSFVKGVKGGLSPLTMGMGISFLHEVMHTPIGGNLSDPTIFGMTGPIVNRMNAIRAELGSGLGQRMSYMGLRLSTSGPAYIPFDSSSLNRLQYGKIPLPKSMFIEY